MIVDISTACDSMNAVFWAAWSTLSPAAAGTTAPVRVEWDGLDDGTARDPQAPFARTTIRHLQGRQATFRGPLGQPRRYTESGMVTIQVFTPLSLRNGSTLAQKLATIARDAFRGGSTPDGVWFQNVVAKEVGADGLGYYQFNVTAAFQYDTLK